MRVEGNCYPLPCLDVFKISKREVSNQPFLLFRCFKIRMKMRENDLNRQIYPYLKIDLQYWFMINLLD